MELLKVQLQEKSNEINPFGVQLDAPMPKNAITEASLIKPIGFPEDARGYYSQGG
jgi:hypothetical protein